MNRCNCPQPPGGHVVCDVDQLAICRVENGNVQTMCLTPPRTNSSLFLVHWCLFMVAEDVYRVRRSRPEYGIDILRSGEYVKYKHVMSPVRGRRKGRVQFEIPERITRFVLPPSIIQAIEKLEKRWNSALGRRTGILQRAYGYRMIPRRKKKS